jgi:D-3-phosphoglycerate dehydrogenase
VKKNIIIDFDSTFITGESLDWLAEIANPSVISQLSEITKQGMSGTIPYQESLKSRLNLFSPNKNHIDLLIEKINTSITPSIMQNQDWIKNHRDHIYIISGGFIDYMKKPLTSFGILPDHIVGNSFIYVDDRVVGFDKNNPLSQNGGKAIIVKRLQLDGEVIVIGDGITDYEIVSYGAADMFVAFTENVSRPSVIKTSKQQACSFNEVISFYES